MTEEKISRIEGMLHGMTPEEQYECLDWLMHKYGMGYNQTRGAIINWLAENDHCSRGVLRQKRCNWELFIEEKEDYEQLKIYGFTNSTLEEVKKRVESLFSKPIRWYGYDITGACGDIESYDRIFMIKIVEKRR